MAFALRRDEEVADGARRTAAKQLEKAIEALEGRQRGDLKAVVHDVRKRGKKARAVARLVRSGVGKGYRRSNAEVREAGRLLAPIRDAHALLGTFDALVAGAGPERPATGLLTVRQGLAARAADASRTANEQDAIADEAAQHLRTALAVVEGWSIPNGLEVVGEGLEVAYRRGRDALGRARRSPSPEAFHEWRKAAKDLWHHTQLLEPAAPTVLTRQAHGLHDLADALGDDHDLAVLVEHLQADEDVFGGRGAVDAAVDLAEAQRADLERRALGLGTRLHAERPKAFVRRHLAYWEAWQELGDEEDTGEIGSISAPTDGLEDRTRTELYALARAADLPGRSSLTRRDLIASLRALDR